MEKQSPSPMHRMPTRREGNGMSRPRRGEEGVHAEGQPLAWEIRALTREEDFHMGKGDEEMGDEVYLKEYDKHNRSQVSMEKGKTRIDSVAWN